MVDGAEARVAISEKVVLDFGGLFSSPVAEKPTDAAREEPKTARGEYDYTPQQENPAEASVEPSKGIEQLQELFLERQRKAERQKLENERSLEICKEYQRNTIQSGELQAEILKGAAAGESLETLFLKAAKAISIMTHNGYFYTQVERDIRAASTGRAGSIHPLQ